MHPPNPPPQGELDLTFCGVERLADWYPALVNPRPSNTAVLHCANEVVFPLMTFALLFVAFRAFFLLSLRLPLWLYGIKPISSTAEAEKTLKTIQKALLLMPGMAAFVVILGT